MTKRGDSGIEPGVPGKTDGEPPREYSNECECDNGGVCQVCRQSYFINHYPLKTTRSREIAAFSFYKGNRKSLKMKMVIYMSVGVCVRLLHWQVDATERSIAGVVRPKDILLNVPVALRWPELIL